MESEGASRSMRDCNVNEHTRSMGDLSSQAPLRSTDDDRIPLSVYIYIYIYVYIYNVS